MESLIDRIIKRMLTLEGTMDYKAAVEQVADELEIDPTEVEGTWRFYIGSAKG